MTITAEDHAPMRRAIEASREALAAGNMPFGATLVSRAGEQLWVAQNNQVTSGDCTGHAEMVLVRDAAKALGADALRGATVYASGEPCAMCAGAMFWAGVRRVVFAAPQADLGRVLGGDLLPIHSAQVYAGSTPPMQVDGPLFADEAIAALTGAASPFDFATFEADERARGCDEVLVRDWAPGTVLDTHSHPFTARALVVRGEMWLSVGESTRHLLPGDRFEIERGVPHAERYGEQGATYWVARRA